MSGPIICLSCKNQGNLEDIPEVKEIVLEKDKAMRLALDAQVEKVELLKKIQALTETVASLQQQIAAQKAGSGGQMARNPPPTTMTPCAVILGDNHMRRMQKVRGDMRTYLGTSKVVGLIKFTTYMTSLQVLQEVSSFLEEHPGQRAHVFAIVGDADAMEGLKAHEANQDIMARIMEPLQKLAGKDRVVSVTFFSLTECQKLPQMAEINKLLRAEEFPQKVRWVDHTSMSDGSETFHTFEDRPPLIMFKPACYTEYAARLKGYVFERLQVGSELAREVSVAQQKMSAEIKARKDAGAGHSGSKRLGAKPYTRDQFKGRNDDRESSNRGRFSSSSSFRSPGPSRETNMSRSYPRPENRSRESRVPAPSHHRTDGHPQHARTDSHYQRGRSANYRPNQANDGYQRR